VALSNATCICMLLGKGRRFFFIKLPCYEHNACLRKLPFHSNRGAPLGYEKHPTGSKYGDYHVCSTRMCCSAQANRPFFVQSFHKYVGDVYSGISFRLPVVFLEIACFFKQLHTASPPERGFFFFHAKAGWFYVYNMTKCLP